MLQWPSFSWEIIKLSSYLNFSWSKTSRLSWAHSTPAQCSRSQAQWLKNTSMVCYINIPVSGDRWQLRLGKRKREQERERGVIITSKRAEWLMTYQLTTTKSNREEVRGNGCVEGYLQIWVLRPIINTQTSRVLRLPSAWLLSYWFMAIHPAYMQSICNNIIYGPKKYVIHNLCESMD